MAGSVNDFVKALDKLGDSDKTKEAKEDKLHICKESVYCKKEFKSKSELQNHIVKFHTEMEHFFAVHFAG